MEPDKTGHDLEKIPRKQLLIGHSGSVSIRLSPPRASRSISHRNQYPYFKDPCPIAGLHEQWIETTFQVVSILMGYTLN
jgi:hypothetical protein